MSKPKRNVKKIVLISLLVVVLLGACFTFVGLYAKREMTKPKFTPPDSTLPSARELPTDKDGVLAYVKELYTAAAGSNDVEMNWHTDIKLNNFGEDVSAPLSDADLEIFKFIREHADEDGLIRSMYPKADNVRQAANEGAYAFDVTADQITGFTAERGRHNDNGDIVDDDYYYVTFELDPAVTDTAAIPESDTYKRFTEALGAAFSVSDPAFEATGVRMNVKIARAFDELVSVEITRAYKATAKLTTTPAYAALAPEGTFEVTFPYESTEKIGFKYYGAHFTQSSIATTPGDMKALPARVNVNSAATEDDYTLTFDVSDDGILKIDEDGVMTVLSADKETVMIKMTLEYEGKTYTDELLVYITELEVATENG
jgi:hypothetical protein